MKVTICNMYEKTLFELEDVAVMMFLNKGDIIQDESGTEYQIDHKTYCIDSKDLCVFCYTIS